MNINDVNHAYIIIIKYVTGIARVIRFIIVPNNVRIVNHSCVKRSPLILKLNVYTKCLFFKSINIESGFFIF